MGLSAAAPALARPAGGQTRGWLKDPAVWGAALFLATFALQRIAVPGLPVPITVPLAVGWLALAIVCGLVELNQVRTLLWLGAAGLSGLIVLVQVQLLANPFVSVNSWALWVVMWLPLVVQFRRRDQSTYLRFTRSIAHVGVGLSALSLVFMGSQLAGVRYSDWLATVVPHDLLVQGYIVSYPISYGSPLYKSNGWIALEPSFMSFFLGVAVVCALIAKVRVVQVLFLIAGLLSTVAGSGIAIVGVYLIALLVQGRIAELRRYLIPGAVTGVIFGFSVLGEAVLSRVTEAGDANSSTSLRTIEPYVQLWPYWVADPAGIVVGHGPGSSANVVEDLAILGLQVPTIAKLVFDYGLIAGFLLLALTASAYFRSPSTAFAITLAASMFLIQGAAQPLAICTIVVLALWSPPTRSPATSALTQLSFRPSPRINSQPG